MTDLTLIGHATRVDFPALELKSVPAKIDTGADSSSIWAQTHLKNDGTLEVVFFSPESQYYTGAVHTFAAGEYTEVFVSNSFGHREARYKVLLGVTICGRRIKGSFTLADRSKKMYPILLGRRILQGKFLVNVSQGEPLRKEEKRIRKLERKINR